MESHISSDLTEFLEFHLNQKYIAELHRFKNHKTKFSSRYQSLTTVYLKTRKIILPVDVYFADIFLHFQPDPIFEWIKWNWITTLNTHLKNNIEIEWNEKCRKRNLNCILFFDNGSRPCARWFEDGFAEIWTWFFF